MHGSGSWLAESCRQEFGCTVHQVGNVLISEVLEQYHLIFDDLKLQPPKLSSHSD